MQETKDYGRGKGRLTLVQLPVLLLFLLLLSLIPPATANVFIINGSTGNTTIQDMINRTSTGDSLFLAGGTYRESIVIDRPIIFGALDTANPPVIMADGQRAGISLDVDGVTLTGVRILGSGPVGLVVQSNNNRVSAVVISGFVNGIELRSATSNIFSGNTIVNNSAGVLIDHQSRSNIFYLNRFDNPEDIAGPPGGNIWFSGGQDYQYEGRDLSGPMGNSWSGYSGTDANSDGIGDTVYVLKGQSASGTLTPAIIDAADRAPLVGQPSEYLIIRSGNETAAGRVNREGNIPQAASDTGLAQNPPGVFSSQPPGEMVPGTGPGITGNPPPNAFPGILLQYWWVVPILILIAAAAGIWYERSRKSRRIVDHADPLQTIPSRNATIVAGPPSASADSTPEHAYFTVRLPPLLWKKYPDAEYMGEGGVGRVFKARDAAENRPIAVKIPVRFDEVTGAQFTKELHIWQGLHHKNIVEVYAANVFPMPYIEMEYIESSLASKKFPLEEAETIRIIRGIAEGLLYAHERGIVHRDIKPENILITTDGTPKITDWGLAKALADTKHTGVISFSLNYAAPEQLAPNIYGEAGPWTDIYQVGVLFYLMMTGKLPFGGTGMGEVTQAILHTIPQPPAITGTNADLIRSIILKCIEKRPADRYRNVSEIMQDLGRLDLGS